MLLVQINLFLSINKTIYYNFKDQIWDYFNDALVKDFKTFHKYFSFVTVALLLIFNLKRTLGAFRYVSLFSFVIYVFIIFVIIF